MLKRFDSKPLFNDALNNGITLFCGSGFSVLSEDNKGNILPVGNGLLDELKKEFEEISEYQNLARACTKISKIDNGRFNTFLEQRFTVEKFNSLYLSLLNINLKSIYTTNIDDLFFKIYEKSPNLYLYDRSQGDEYRKNNIVDYFPLHGCVKNKGNYIFGSTEIATAFSNSKHKNAWSSLSKDSAKNPILFWGWNFEDSGPIEAMYGNNSKIDENIEKWVLLYNPTAETIDYLESLKFNIIIGDTFSMLCYIDKLNINKNITNLEKIKYDSDLDIYRIPDSKTIPSYSISKYFSDYSPQWSQIYSGKLPRIKYYTEIANLISEQKNIFVIGIRCSGKTTLMMQLLCFLKTKKPKYYMIAPTVNEVKSFLNKIDNNEIILFVDDCFRDTDAVIELLKRKNIQTVLFDRDFNYERQFHKISNERFEKVDITEITKEDAQSILNVVPIELRKNYTTTKHLYKDPTILNLLASNMKPINFKFIKNFYENDYDSARVFLMICYVHSCGVPCSFDMVYSYLGDEKYTWHEMFEIINKIGGLLQDLTIVNSEYSFIDSLQNYYQCRSRYFAEKIISSIPQGNKEFKNVLLEFTQNVPQYKICQYDKFRRSAYDSKIIGKVFIDIDEGEKFYQLCSEKDDSEYIYQQAALYFSEKNQYKTAFEWIDKARSFAHYNRFSIDSTYAQIFFDTNYQKNEELEYEALSILKDCCESDKRKILHVEEFSKRVICYYREYQNDRATELVKAATEFVENSISLNNTSTSQINRWRLNNIKKQLDQIK